MKVYVLVRKDIDYSSHVVQAGHALIELSQAYDVKEWACSHKTIVCLAVRCESELLHYFKSIPILEKSLFREPDFKNEFTAMAVLVKNKEDQKFFKKLKLL